PPARVGVVYSAAAWGGQATDHALGHGIAGVRPGARLGAIGHAIARHARSPGDSVGKEYCGPGLGQEMHEVPQILPDG
ncbi:M24 family metallopeptidase, partial [Stenotrophomonas maltophilia]|uniref:M24 family metallopeptidase n=1 Tax=Stenotrophomonas maltophilia TaxID=40324 RepID=UPI0031450D3B